MAKLTTYFRAFFLACLRNCFAARAVSSSLRSSCLEELKTASINFKTEVNFVMNVGQAVITEDEKLLESLYSSAAAIQKKVSDVVNGTMTAFGSGVNNIYSDASFDVTKCMAMSSAIESKATDVLIDANACVYDKLNEARVYVEKSVSFVEYILARLVSLGNNVEGSYLKIMKQKNIIKLFLQTKIFLESIYTEASNVAAKILSTLTDTALEISRIDSLMISDCVSTESVSSLTDDARLVYSKIDTCIADLNSPEAELQSLSPDVLRI